MKTVPLLPGKATEQNLNESKAPENQQYQVLLAGTGIIAVVALSPFIGTRSLTATCLNLVDDYYIYAVFDFSLYFRMTYLWRLLVLPSP